MSERRGERDRGPFAEWVRERRMTLGLSVREFAGLADMPENFVTAVETGRIVNTRKYRANLARALGVTEAELVARAGGLDLDAIGVVAAEEEVDPVVTAILSELRELGAAGRRMVLDQVRAAGRWQREVTGRE